MSFWGIEVKPKKSHPYHSDNVKGILHISQATLGLGSSTEKCVLQCFVGHKKPIFLCTLIPDKLESCSLNLQYNEKDLVTFSVSGSRSVHLSGYFEPKEGEHLPDEYDSDSFSEDIDGTDTEDSSDFDSEDEYYDDDFIDDEAGNGFMFCESPPRKSGVIIEEILDDENDHSKQQKKRIESGGSAVVIEEVSDDDKPANENARSKQEKKKNQSGGSKGKQIVAKVNASVAVSDSEDEDGFPIGASHKAEAILQELDEKVDVPEDNIATKETKKKQKIKTKGEGDDVPTADKKRKVKSIDEDSRMEKKKKQKRKNETKVVSVAEDGEGDDLSKDDQKQVNDEAADVDMVNVPSENGSEKKKAKKKKKKKAEDSDNKSDKQTPAKPSQVRTFGNGLVIEEVAMGRPDGKRASLGNKVSVRYIGKLKKDGKIFDSNIGKAPFKFRLGVGQVIKGWDVGVNGMRVGDKRKLTIPPTMGYGSRGAGGKIPPNAWLEFDVELLGAS